MWPRNVAPNQMQTQTKKVKITKPDVIEWWWWWRENGMGTTANHLCGSGACRTDAYGKGHTEPQDGSNLSGGLKHNYVVQQIGALYSSGFAILLQLRIFPY